MRKSPHNKLSLVEVKRRLKEIHGNVITLDESTYVHTRKRARFIDIEYGEWWAQPGKLFLGRSHPERGRLRGLRNSKRAHLLKHWKTGEELICIANYELAFVRWCNFNCIDFDWQIPHKTPDNRIYIIDALIKDGEFANTWIEIKGTFLRRNGQVGKTKWEWFHSKYQNSQLWDLEILVKHQILVRKTVTSKGHPNPRYDDAN